MGVPLVSLTPIVSPDSDGAHAVYGMGAIIISDDLVNSRCLSFVIFLNRLTYRKRNTMGQFTIIPVEP
jgi:hypothetical protein